MSNRPKQRAGRPCAPPTPASSPLIVDKAILSDWVNSLVGHEIDHEIDRQVDRSEYPEDPDDEVLLAWWERLSPVERLRSRYSRDFETLGANGCPFELLRLDNFDDNGFPRPAEQVTLATLPAMMVLFLDGVDENGDGIYAEWSNAEKGGI